MTKVSLNNLAYSVFGVAIEVHKSLYEAQTLTYMKLLQAPKGILINFNCNNLYEEGSKTFVNEYFNKLK